MSDKPDLKVVVDIGLPGLQNIPAMLRVLADSIEAGTYGSWQEVVVVLNCQEDFAVFGYGLTTGSDAPALLSAGLAKFAKPLLEKARS